MRRPSASEAANRRLVRGLRGWVGAVWFLCEWGDPELGEDSYEVKAVDGFEEVETRLSASGWGQNKHQGMFRSEIVGVVRCARTEEDTGAL